MDISSIRPPEASGPTLCHAYVTVLFDTIPVLPTGDTGVHPEPMIWAVGILSDRLPDYLGAWPCSGPKDSLWLSIAEDLKSRGAERIRCAIGPDPLEIQAAFEAHYPHPHQHCTALPLSGRSVDPSWIEALPPGHRPHVERALEVGRLLGARLQRAVARHGRFAYPAAAAELLRSTADRFIYAHWPEPSALPLPTPRQTARHDGMSFSA